MSYLTESLRPRSEKITLVTVESVERLKLFTANGSDWDRVTDYFVIGVKDDGVIITSWSFNAQTKTLKIIGGADPKTRKISVIYRHFYSTTPVNLPYDLLSGEAVEWEARVNSIGSIGQQLDDENTGIVLESSSSVDLINSDAFFDSFFDTHIWENQSIKFYSWFPNIPISEKVQLFEGVIESKSFSSQKISFKVKDFVFKLKNQLSLPNFVLTGMSVLPSLLYTPMRRIYGQVDNVKCASLDAILEGYVLSGTISITLGSLTVVGVGTNFLDDCSPGDEFFVYDANEIKYVFGIESVDTDTQITLGKIAESSFSAIEMYLKPALSPYYKNRSWSVAGHKLREASSEITIVQSSNTFSVDTTLDMQAGDEININGILSTIRRVSGSMIITTSNIVPLPTVGDFIVKRPIKKVFHGKTELIYARDFLIVNATEAKIIFHQYAEFNVAEQRSTGSNVTFTNGSRIVNTAIDLRPIIFPRDWIRSSNASRSEWYEVLSVSDIAITLRTVVAYSGGPYTETAYYKNITPIDENSLITANCLGMEYQNTWMKTASDCVRHLVLNDAAFPTVNEATFAKAKADCDYTISLVIPETLGQKSPLIRDVISNLNSSVFGSLYGDSSQNISYSILNSTKPELSNIIRDDDIISFSVETTQKIANKVTLKYRPYVDIYSETDALLSYSHDSKFVDDFIGIKNTIERTVYLYDTSKVIIMAQRVALFNSLSSSVVKLKAKMNLAQVLVNDKIYLQLDRLYARFGGLDQRKLGTVTGVKLGGFSTEVILSDLGNVYNRVPSIAPSSTLDYSSASSDDKIKWGFIVNNDTETADATSEQGLGNYIIG